MKNALNERMIGIEPHWGGRIEAALLRTGLTAAVTIVADEPLPLPPPGPMAILGSRGGPSVPSLTVVLRPLSDNAAEAHRWARQMIGQAVVQEAAADLFPAHVGVRVGYMVPAGRGSWFVSDPPRFGTARLGRTYLERPMKKCKKTTTISCDAPALELMSDICEVFEIAQEDPRFDELLKRRRRQLRKARVNGQIIDPAELDQLEDRIASLERMLVDVLGQLRQLARKHPRIQNQASSISINPLRR